MWRVSSRASPLSTKTPLTADLEGKGVWRNARNARDSVLSCSTPLPVHTLLLSGLTTAITLLESGSVPSLKHCEINVSWSLEPFNCLSQRDKAVKDSVAVFQDCQWKQTTAESQGKEQQSDSDYVVSQVFTQCRVAGGVQWCLWLRVETGSSTGLAWEQDYTWARWPPPSTALRLREKRELFGLVPTITGCRNQRVQDLR